MTWTVFPAPFNLHRYHTSLTRIEYKSEAKNIEITIRLFTDDLEKSLERFAKKRIEFEKNKEADKIIEKYVAENFVLTDKTGGKLQLNWIGKEINADMMTIYLECASGESVEKYNLQNTLLFDSFPDQTNLIIATFENKKVDLLFKSGDKFKIIA